jgi:hypothetical protein
MKESCVSQAAAEGSAFSDIGLGKNTLAPRLRIDRFSG